MTSFGIKTSQMRTTYADILRIWEEADELPELEHAWVWDHLLPLSPDPTDPVQEGWTLLAALAARTTRLRLGHLVTSNALRHPALLAKMAATVDEISAGRLVLGLGVGGTRQPDGVPNPAVREYAAYDVPLRRPREGIARLDEACTLIRELWTGETVDHGGEHYRLSQAVLRPVPVQRPGPPLLIGGWGDRTLEVVARHADLWNVPGPPHQEVAALQDRSRALDRACERVGRDPGEITRSTQVVVDRSDATAARAVVRQVADTGFDHVVVGVRSPEPAGVARWLVEEVITPVRG